MRVEVAAPVIAPLLKQRIRYMFNVMECETVKGRSLNRDGNYIRRFEEEASVLERIGAVNEEGAINSQEYFFNEAYQAADK